jgi:hypothetical protein
MGDQDQRVNQKFDEFIAEGARMNPFENPHVVVRTAWETLIAWGVTQGISVRLPDNFDAQRYFQYQADRVYTAQIKHHCDTQLREFVAKYMSPQAANLPGLPAREACRKAVEDLTDWIRSKGYPANQIQLGEQEFELLVQLAEKGAETYRANQEKGLIPLGQHGVYIDKKSDEEYDEIMKRVGLA